MEEIFLQHGAIRSEANRLRGNTEWTELPRVGNYLVALATPYVTMVQQITLHQAHPY
jgi:hypothetical protein